MAVPNIFGSATSAIPLSQLDQNFATAITLGNTAVYLGNTTTSLGNVTLTNVTISSGNVSVSTATVGAGSNTAPSITTTGDTNTGIFFPAADTIAFSEGGTEAMRLDSAGNMGLGVTPQTWNSSARALQISGFTCVAQQDTGSYIAGFNFYQSTTGFRYLSTNPVAMYSARTDGSHAFFNAASGTAGNAITFTQAMTLDASGSLGIGVTSPNNTLAVGISAANSGIDLESISNGGTFARFGLVGPFGTDNDTYIGSISNNNFLFYTNNTERARITSGGNLLLGTTTDNARFAVSAPTATTSNRVAIFTSTSASDNGAECIATVKTSTSTTTDNTFLKFYIGGGASGSGQINANGASAAAFGTLSDSRIKENIVDLPSQLDNIMALRPVEYDYIESEGGGHQIGFVAQEVQPIYPDLVGERQDGMLTLTDLNKNDARLIKAIQELKAIVDAQAVEIAALKGTA